jgi:NAD(P)-dependent dehydrogenase (short-subunit alcohol dehydrogenase family)
MLKDKVIVITGSSRGIGEAIARACGDACAREALASRKQADLGKDVASLQRERELASASHAG